MRCAARHSQVDWLNAEDLPVGSRPARSRDVLLAAWQISPLRLCSFTLAKRTRPFDRESVLSSIYVCFLHDSHACAVPSRASCPPGRLCCIVLIGRSSVRSAHPSGCVPCSLASSPVTKRSKYFCSATFSGSFVFGPVRPTAPRCLVSRAPVRWDAAGRCHERVMVAHGSLLLQAYIDRHDWIVVGFSCCVLSACPAWSCCVLCLSLGPAAVVSRVARTLPLAHEHMRARGDAQFFCPCAAAIADSTAAPGDTRKLFLIQHEAFQRLTCMVRAQT